MAKNEFDILRNAEPPKPDEAAKARALASAMAAFDEAEKNIATTQGSAGGKRLTDRTMRFWREMMQKKLVAVPALAGLVALPVAGYVGWQVMEELRLAQVPADAVVETKAPARQQVQPAQEAQTSGRSAPEMIQAAPPAILNRATRDAPVGRDAVAKLLARPAPAGIVAPEPYMRPQERERFQSFDTNPVRAALESPVSTFSIDVDTASYAFVRRSLMEGSLPQPDSVRVEEMVNYFSYDWPGPSSAQAPFNTSVTVTPTPWNADTRLMHVAIKGYDVKPAEKPRSNLVFLIDTSGSMNTADKLPLLKSSFRLLVDQLEADDTVAIVTYAGSAGTVLEPTKIADKGKILAALDALEAGGSTAGEAGIREAYRLAESSFVEGGVNRIMLATDGDFNVGQTSDEALKRLVENKRKNGVYLSVLGFGRGNLNDAMMQAIAQNGNGVAAYIDTLAEAQKVLSEEASSALFTIASDVKIQVEFNPARIAEYRLIGYESRALNREDFNNERVDAGDIGSGHSVTAIYEVTPVGSKARMIDDLRYGTSGKGQGAVDEGEYAFVKIRYKAPGEEASKLIETPVSDADFVTDFAQASDDLRFSVAVAAFGQKLRGTDAVAGYDYDRIMEIAAAARGADPFGYRAEFLSLVRLASALEGKR